MDVTSFFKRVASALRTILACQNQPTVRLGKEKAMLQTEHTVRTPESTGYRVTVNHEDYEAIQYEFYIPEAIWNHSSVQTFLQRLETIEAGATIFAGLVGVWQGATEQSCIYRMIVWGGKFCPAKTRATLHSEVGRLMADLSVSNESAQEAFMFTETKIRVTKSGGVTCI